MEISNPLVTSETVLMQVIQSDATNNAAQFDETDKIKPNVDHVLSTQPTNFTRLVSYINTHNKGYLYS